MNENFSVIRGALYGALFSLPIWLLIGGRFITGDGSGENKEAYLRLQWTVNQGKESRGLEE